MLLYKGFIGLISCYQNPSTYLNSITFISITLKVTFFMEQKTETINLVENNYT